MANESTAAPAGVEPAATRWDGFAVSHVGGRPTNEDAALAASLRNAAGTVFGLALVADGIGGCGRGDVASEVAACAVRDCLVAATFSSLKEAREAFAAAIDEANLAVQGLQTADLAPGTTFSGLVVVGNDGIIANVGDSRIYRHGVYGLAQVSTDRGGSVNGISGVSRWLGQTHLEVDWEMLDSLTDDALLLASDGVYRVLSSSEITAMLSGRDAREAAEGLVRLALERGTLDNASAAVARVLPLPPPRRWWQFWPRRAGASRRGSAATS
jgi:serine/threonine protein phosphatase PrpC